MSNITEPVSQPTGEDLARMLVDITSRVETISAVARSTGGDLKRLAELRAQLGDLGEIYLACRIP